MASVFDVAEYILKEVGPISAMKLQKLVYYSQAWHLVWADKPLFDSHIEAWANGPVSPELYSQHKGRFQLGQHSFYGNPSALTRDEADSVDSVLRTYADKSSQWLSDLTHMEAPWREAREGIPDGERSDREITPGAMVEYYGSL